MGTEPVGLGSLVVGGMVELQLFEIDIGGDVATARVGPPVRGSIVGTVGNPLNVRAIEIYDAATEAVRDLATVDPKDTTAKADWLKQASLVESRLTDMETELADLLKRNPKRNLRRVKDAGRSISALKVQLTRKVADLYGL